MVIKTTQKVIKVGDSKGITLPAKELKNLGVEIGDEVIVKVEKLHKQKDGVLKEYEAFKQQYGQTLKNLKDR